MKSDNFCKTKCPFRGFELNTPIERYLISSVFVCGGHLSLRQVSSKQCKTETPWHPLWPPRILLICYTLFDVVMGRKKYRFSQKALLLKVRKSQNDFFKQTFPPKNERTNSTLLQWNLRSTCFRSFFGGNWRHQKDISKLSDL